MKIITKLMAAIVFIWLSMPVAQSAIRVGIYKDRRSYITDGLILTLENAGYVTEIIDRKIIQDADNLKDLDVIYLPGGWNAGRWAGFMGRKNLVDFVARGKGILAGAFRGGYARNTERPLFPEIGEIYRKANGCGVIPVGDGPLTENVSSFYAPNFDHMVARVGPAGRVFVTDSGGAPVGVYGEVAGGRYIILGLFIGMNARDKPMEGSEKTLFLNCIGWLSAVPPMSAEAITENRAAIEHDFLIREMLLDYALDRQGPDNGPGVIPQIAYELRTPLESREIRLKRAVKLLSGKDRASAEKALAAVRRALHTLDRNYSRLLARVVNEIKAKSREELIVDNPFFNEEGVVARIDASNKPDAEKAAARMQVEKRFHHLYDLVSKNTAAFLYGDMYRETIFPEAELKSEIAEADRVLSKLEPKIEAARRTAIADEWKRDQARVPGLIADCSSKDSKVRLEAVVELGRIGDPRAVDALVGLLNDPDEDVRINAILALGWMQADKAVPALIEATKSENRWVRRRSVQALGQIGDKRAVPVLLENVDSTDFHTKENAVLALGWVKTDAAVPRLIEIVESSDREDPIQRSLMIDAIRALGHIGDKRALPVLKHRAETADDFPAPRRSRYGTRISDIYSTALSLGLQGHAELAMEEIEAGGLAGTGIRQNDRLWRQYWFYGLKKNFNFFAGRALKVNHIPPVFGDEPEQLIDFLYDVGATGINNAWGDQNDGDPAKRMNMVKAMEKYDMRLIDTMPARGDHFTYKHPYEKPTPLDRTLEKAGAELVMLHYSDTPVFQGFWTEEDYPNVPMCLGFEQWLENRYGPEWRSKLNIPEDLNLDEMKNAVPLMNDPKTRAAFAEFLEWAGETLMEWWREDQQFLSGFRKGCAFAFNSTILSTYPGVAGKAGGIIDAHGPEDYQCFGSDNDLMIELAKDGEARPVMCEFYDWYSPSPDHSERAYAQHLVSGECFFNFNIYQIFKQPCSSLWVWSPERWNRAKKTFNKARRLKEYLAVPASAANVALVASERSKLLFYSRSYGERVPLSRRYYENLSGLWSVLRQSHIPVDAVWAESMTPEKLARYKCLVLPDAKCLTNEECELLGQWVKSGGILIATGTSTLFERTGAMRKNYAMADVFGVNYLGHVAETDPDRVDTWCFDRGKNHFKAVGEQYDREKIRNYVHRDIKPAGSIGTYTVKNSTQYLETPENGMICEYDMALGYDKVRPSGASVLAAFPDGDPALTVNEFGKGLCYFWTPVYPGLCHVCSGWEMQPNFKDFWRGVRELLADMIESGLARQGETLPVVTEDCSKNVFVNVKKQPEKRRFMVHMLNMDTESKRVHGINMSVRVPDTKNTEVYYPDTDTNVPFHVVGDRVMFTPRDFEVHDMIVISY